MTRKVVSQMYYNGELEQEARNGQLCSDEIVLHLNTDKLDYMQYVVQKQGSKTYQDVPRSGCIKRGIYGAQWRSRGGALGA